MLMPFFGNIMRVTVIFASCKKLGIGDHIVWWQRPQQCPHSMARADNESVTDKYGGAGSACIDSTTGVSTQGIYCGYHLSGPQTLYQSQGTPNSINDVGKQRK